MGPVLIETADEGGYDSDSSFFEEESDKKFLNSLKTDLEQHHAHRESHKGLRRQTGHYKFPDRRHATSDATHERFYTGHNWEVPGLYPTERSTRYLTIRAIELDVEAEQQRRCRMEERLQERAATVLRGLNDEYATAVGECDDRQRKDALSQLDTQETEFDQVMNDFIHYVHRHEADDDEHQECAERMQLLAAMTGGGGLEDCGVELPREVIQGFAEVNSHMALFQQDMMEAMGLLEDDMDEIEEEDVDRSVDLLDLVQEQFMTTVHSSDMSREMEEERMRRIRQLINWEKGREKNASLKVWRNVNKEVKYFFNDFLASEEKAAKELHKTLEMIKTITQEEVVRRQMTAFVRNLCAQEKARRCQELLDAHKTTDPQIERLKTYMDDVRRQMVKSFVAKDKAIMRTTLPGIQAKREEDTKKELHPKKPQVEPKATGPVFLFSPWQKEKH